MLNKVLGSRDARFALLGRAVSTFGDGVALTALTLRLQADRADPYDIALLFAAGGLPQLLVAGPVGRLVDAHDSRRLLVAGGLTEAAVSAALIFIHPVLLIFALVAVLGAAASLSVATWTVLLPRVVGAEHVAEAVSTQSSLNVLALVGAPAAGGLLTGSFGAGVPIALDAATFIAVSVGVSLMRTRRTPERSTTKNEPVSAGGGFALLQSDRVLAPLVAGVALVVLLVGMVDVVLVFLVRDTLHARSIWYGVTEASWMAGMVVGSMGAGRLKNQHSQVRATIAGVALICAALAAFAAAPTVWILAVLSVLGGIGNGYAGTCLSTLVMTRTPDKTRGRVSAATGAILGAAQGLSLALGGVAAALLSPRTIYAFAGLLGLIPAGILAVAHRAPGPEPERALQLQGASFSRAGAGSTESLAVPAKAPTASNSPARP